MTRPVPLPAGPGQESVWDYPRPPRLEASAREVVVVLGGVEVCRTRRAWRVLETSHPPTWYLPREDWLSGALEPAPGRAQDDDGDARLTYVLNPRFAMSTGKSIAQVAHAAVMAAGTGALDGWVEAGCPGRVLAPSEAVFDALCRSDDLAARVEDAGLTEVPPGTVTVLALAALPAELAPA